MPSRFSSNLCEWILFETTVRHRERLHVHLHYNNTQVHADAPNGMKGCTVFTRISIPTSPHLCYAYFSP